MANPLKKLSLLVGPLLRNAETEFCYLSQSRISLNDVKIFINVNFPEYSSSS